MATASRLPTVTIGTTLPFARPDPTVPSRARQPGAAAGRSHVPGNRCGKLAHSFDPTVEDSPPGRRGSALQQTRDPVETRFQIRQARRKREPRVARRAKGITAHQRHMGIFEQCRAELGRIPADPSV